MLTSQSSLVLLLVLQLVAGQLQCPNVAASFGEDLDLSSFYVALDDGSDDGSAGASGTRSSDYYNYLITGGIVTQDVFIAVNGSTSIALTATLQNSTNLPQVYMIISTVDDQSVCVNNSDVDQPLVDEKSVELQIECSAVSARNVTLCVHLTDQPFKEGNGTYHVITVLLNINCTGVRVMESQCERASPNDDELGLFCLTPSQIDILFNSGEGQWGALLDAARNMDFCIVRRTGVVAITSVGNLEEFPIYRNLSTIQFDIVNNDHHNSPYPLIFFVNFTSTNNLVTVAKLNTTTGIVKPYDNITFEVALPCFLEEGVLINLTLRWSQFQQNGQLIHAPFDFQFYRSCISNTNNSNEVIITEEGGNSMTVIIVVPIVVVLVFSLLLIVSTILCVLYYHTHYKKYPVRQNVVMNHAAVNPYYTLRKIQSPLKELEQYGIEYNYDMLNIDDKIGEGEFGVVYKARAPGLKRGDWEIGADEFVAVKMLKSDAEFETMLDFQKEVETVVNFEHKNVIRLLGICTKQIDQTCMIFEYMELGALGELLRKSNPRNPDFYQLSPDEVIVKPSQFLSICIQLAKGLDYLSKKRFVHRDIATRNCLVDSQFVCKIADFGLSRDVYGSDYYKVGGGSACLPVRWMPPESLLYGRFTIKSDVWSYGILMWEVFTFATQPYFGASNQEVIDNIRGLVLLECPSLCTQEIYDIMLECWQKMPVKRPHIGEILESLERLRENNVTVVKDIEKNYINLQPFVVVNTNATDTS